MRDIAVRQTMLRVMSNRCEVSGLLAVAFIAIGLGLIFAAFALVFDFKGFRTRQVQRDKRVNRWLHKRHLWFNDQREYHSRYFIQAGIATFMGLVVIAGSVDGLITC